MISVHYYKLVVKATVLPLTTAHFLPVNYHICRYAVRYTFSTDRRGYMLSHNPCYELGILHLSTAVHSCARKTALFTAHKVQAL